MFNYLAPAGTPIKVSDLLLWLLNDDGGKSAIDIFERKIQQKFDVKHCFFISTGRAAMAFLLQQMKTLSSNMHKNEIIIPSYTCYSVPASIIKAGFKPRICDIDKKTLSYNLDLMRNIDFENVFAIITSNLYGIPNDLVEIEKIAHENSVYLIDDAAQSMGASVNGRYAGTFGDAGIFSLDKGKNITSINGGIIVTNNDELASVLNKEFRALPARKFFEDAIDLAKLFIYTLLLPPGRYWLLKYLPFIGLGKTLYTTNFSAEKYSQRLAKIGHNLFARLGEINASRTANARLLLSLLKDNDNLTIPVTAASSASSVYLRLPVLFKNREMRDRALQLLNDSGIGATCSYPLSIGEIPELQYLFDNMRNNYTVGREVSRTILTLPTHAFVEKAHIEKMSQILRNTLST